MNETHNNIHESLLAWLVSPISKGRFFSDYWEKKPLVINRETPDYFSHLLSFKDIDTVITSPETKHPNVFLTNADKDDKELAYIGRNNTIDTAKIYEGYTNGSTIVLNGLHKRIKELASFCRRLEKEFSFPFQTNIYMTPSASKGFKTHYDSHDVFVLQISGSKHWFIYDTPINLPLSGQKFDSSKHNAGEVTLEFDLFPGDLLYIPRGVMHDARSNNEDSLHITVGALTNTWTNLMLEALAEVCLNNVAFRQSLPVGFTHSSFNMNEAEQVFCNLLKEFSEKANLKNALNIFVDELSCKQNTAIEGQLEQLRQIDNINRDTLFSSRSNLIYRIESNEERCSIIYKETELSIPSSAIQTLKFALEEVDFTIQDMPRDLDEPGRLTLLQRLIREGLVKIN